VTHQGVAESQGREYHDVESITTNGH
jgi:hypothetical protein